MKNPSVIKINLSNDSKPLKSSDATEPQGFTGLARSVQAYDNQGFRNFRIVTLHIQNGKVIKQEYSDPYASFEAISRMEIQNEMSIHHLNNTWADGKSLTK
jgi:hypothetical protein